MCCSISVRQIPPAASLMKNSVKKNPAKLVAGFNVFKHQGTDQPQPPWLPQLLHL